MDDDLRLDGNAIAGLLTELFGRDMTNAMITCAGCGATRQVGALVVYRHGMGAIVRCTACDQILIPIAEMRGQAMLDPRGIATLQIAMSGATANGTAVS